MTLFKKYWWKFLGVLLFLYVFLGGLLIPLRTGISEISTNRAFTGQKSVFEITGYNSHFESDENKVFARTSDDWILKASEVLVKSDNVLEATFDIPNKNPNEENLINVTLLVKNMKDGVSILPKAFSITKSDSLSSSTSWENADKYKIVQNSDFRFPYRNILQETIRNTFFHVAIWMAMYALLIVGIYFGIRYLRTSNYDDDIIASSITEVAVFIGVLGMLTGSFWAKFAWGQFWPNDVKLNMAAIAMLIYFAYIVLRNSISDQDRRAKVSAIYSIFAFLAMIPLVFILPRMTDSLHPGNGGNPAFGSEDMENTLRTFFYPAILAFFLVGLWLSQLVIRYRRLKDKFFLKEINNEY